MDREAVRKAVEVLQLRLEEIKRAYERDKAELEHAIESLKSGDTHREGGYPAVERGRWDGMSITESMEEYLALCDGTAAPVSIVLQALKRGGAQIGENPQRWRANLKAAVATAKRDGQKRFRYKERTDVVELRSLKGARPAVRRDQPAAATIDAPGI